MTKAPRDAHEWVSFEDDEEDRTWRFDLTYLESNWVCIFNDGCQGVLTEATPELGQGCCSYGAHLLDEEDERRTLQRAKQLTAKEWQFKDVAPDELIMTNEAGDRVTAQVDDACVFLNRPDFALGSGCAFHVAAANHNESFVQWKPEVCWQLPLRRDEEEGPDDHVTTSIGQWERRHWGDGGFEFHWWCSEDPSAYRGTSRVVDTMKDELIEMIGKRNYKRLLAFMDERAARTAKGQLLPHPVVRSKTKQA